MLRIVNRLSLPTLRSFSSRITIDNINQHIRTADYAVRGEVTTSTSTFALLTMLSAERL